MTTLTPITVPKKAISIASTMLPVSFLDDVERLAMIGSCSEN